ncbi:GNAT family N-acetyltransferase [Lacimicrobium alkaliphilum]|uniref:N-acetyltransferase n=1 Tax=Lacimicrobium alkaliphilum TaxID=1526571 RepID=A0ABQ1R877_9ALTE|nr:GNAT family N-acetyltransferase [Lacimicrobium alkaliphilum]GGD59810.1 N-acetyltransferase [Lacimicrobium alkaliphilum]
MLPITTPRLSLRLLDDNDAAFILELLNDPDFLKYIGDRGVSNIEEAIGYIQQGPLAMYQQHGFCMLRVGLKDTEQAIGLCGLLQRDNLPHPDLGFAFLPSARGTGMATEAAEAILQQADKDGHKTILAFCQPDNQGSVKLLRRVGFAFKGDYRQKPDEQLLHLYQRDNPAPG